MDFKIKGKEVQLVPLSQETVTETVETLEYGKKYVYNLEIIEDLLVPDTEADMERLLFTKGKITDLSCRGGRITGSLQVTVFYTDPSEALSVLESPLEINGQAEESISDNSYTIGKIRKLEGRRINERKYKISGRLEVIIRDREPCKREIIKDIKGQPMEWLKEKQKFLNVTSIKRKESEILENLTVKTSQPTAVKILYSDFDYMETAAKVTSEKIIVNGIIFVRGVYLAEIQGKEGVFNRPEHFAGKMDHTEIIHIDEKDKNLKLCRVNVNPSGLSVEPDEEKGGITVSGKIITEADAAEERETEIIKDFYHREYDVMRDEKEQEICCSMNRALYTQDISHIINLKGEGPAPEEIIFADVSLENVKQEGNNVAGKAAITLICRTGDKKITAAKHMADFEMKIEKGEVTNVTVSAIEASLLGDGNGKVTAVITAETEERSVASIKTFSNICVEKGGRKERSFPIRVCTVGENQTLWDLSKEFKVPVENIKQVNKIDDVAPAMKILIVK